jgi:cell division protein FtsL
MEERRDSHAAFLIIAFICIVTLAISTIMTSYRIADLIIRIEALEKEKK